MFSGKIIEPTKYINVSKFKKNGFALSLFLIACLGAGCVVAVINLISFTWALSVQAHRSQSTCKIMSSIFPGILVYLYQTINFFKPVYRL